MQKRASILPIGLFFVISSFLLLFINQGGFMFSLFERVILPLQKITYEATVVFGVLGKQDGKKEKQIDSNLQVSEALVVSKEMQALRDQFETTSPPSQQLLPSHVIGLEGYIPGISRPNGMILDKGVIDKVVPGLAVVYKNNLVGRVMRVTKTRSEVSLLTKNDLSFTGRTQKNDANGLVRIESSEIFLKNVLLSDKLSVSDFVVTKGDEDLSGNGFPPDIVVGKIISIDKKPSALFQTAKVASLIEPVSLRMVFIYMQQ